MDMYEYVMDMLWICYGYVMDMLWICYGYVMDMQVWKRYQCVGYTKWIAKKIANNGGKNVCYKLSGRKWS